MRFYRQFLIFILISLAFAACSTAPKKSLTPLETLKEYGEAFRKKDITAMKLLLSEESLKMHEQEAKAQNTSVDEIVKRETLFTEGQTRAEFRNQKIEDDKATIEMKDSMGIWNTVHFVREDGAWKIDKKGFANQIEQLNQEKNSELDQLINNSRIGNTNDNSGIGNINDNKTGIGNTNENPIVTGSTNRNQNSLVNANEQP